jgi:hypothetical protein
MKTRILPLAVAASLLAASPASAQSAYDQGYAAGYANGQNTSVVNELQLEDINRRLDERMQREEQNLQQQTDRVLNAPIPPESRLQ